MTTPTPEISLPFDSRWATRTPTETTSFDVDLTGAALLSDLNLQASVPVAQWRGDHWNVVWSSLGTSFDGSPAEPRLYAAAVTRAGHAERRAIPFSDQGPEPLQRGQDARVARVVSAGSWWNAGDCRIELIDTAALAVLPAFSFACGGEAAVTPLQDSEDWLVLWPRADQSGGPTGTDLMLARYRPSAARWVAGPWSVALAVPNGSLSVGTAGTTAWVVWGEDPSTSAVAVPNVAGSVPAEPGANGGRRDLHLSSSEDSHPTLVRSGPDALMFAADGTALVAVRLRADGSVGTPIELAPSSVFDRPPGVAAAPEHGLFGVCYPVRAGTGWGDGDRVALVTVNSAGALVGGPHVVAEGIENVGGCDVAWSGSELLVAWWDISLNAPRADPMSSTLRARILPLP